MWTLHNYAEKEALIESLYIMYGSQCCCAANKGKHKSARYDWLAEETGRNYGIKIDADKSKVLRTSGREEPSWTVM